MTQETIYNVGDDVSHGIGGDRYYDGKIVRMTKRFITTDRGTKYTRKVAKMVVCITPKLVADIVT